jgi:hypothetical protein
MHSYDSREKDEITEDFKNLFLLRPAFREGRLDASLSRMPGDAARIYEDGRKR